eukprot:Rhum_TRINITY_DN14296_c0_g1::Rhum_TRINITY_DN14296_c0_g1_i1::g.77401::m.77401
MSTLLSRMQYLLCICSGFLSIRHSMPECVSFRMSDPRHSAWSLSQITRTATPLAWQSNTAFAMALFVIAKMQMSSDSCGEFRYFRNASIVVQPSSSSWFGKNSARDTGSPRSARGTSSTVTVPCPSLFVTSTCSPSTASIWSFAFSHASSAPLIVTCSLAGALREGTTTSARHSSSMPRSVAPRGPMSAPYLSLGTASSYSHSGASRTMNLSSSSRARRADSTLSSSPMMVTTSVPRPRGTRTSTLNSPSMRRMTQPPLPMTSPCLADGMPKSTEGIVSVASLLLRPSLLLCLSRINELFWNSWF